MIERKQRRGRKWGPRIFLKGNPLQGPKLSSTRLHLLQIQVLTQQHHRFITNSLAHGTLRNIQDGNHSTLWLCGSLSYLHPHALSLLDSVSIHDWCFCLSYLVNYCFCFKCKSVMFLFSYCILLFQGKKKSILFIYNLIIVYILNAIFLLSKSMLPYEW